MSFLFRKNAEQNTAKDKTTAEPGCDFQHLKAEIESLHGQVNTIHIAVSSHQKLIDRNYTMITQHTGKLQSLEDKLAAGPGNQPTSQDTTSIEQTPQQQPSKLELSRFTPQEKKILSIFFNDRDMQLSYADIGRTMGKSPHTIKNHMRQMRMKADIFRQKVTDEGRKRFQLKDGLEIQNYLNVQAD